MTNETTASQPKNELAPDLYDFEGGRNFVLRLEQVLSSQPNIEYWRLKIICEALLLNNCVVAETEVDEEAVRNEIVSQPKSIGDDAQFQLMMFGKVGLDPKGMTFKNIAAYIDNFRAPAAQASATIQAAPEGYKLMPVDPATQLGLGWAYLDAARADDPSSTWRFSHAGYRAMIEAATIQEPVMVAEPDWKPGTWFEARTLDEMEAFYMSRLPMIRAAAKEHGYAIGLHGTARRDFDLMAMQWRVDASDKDSLARAVADAACGIRREGAYDWEVKPSGRVAVSIPVCWTDHSNPDFDKPSIGHIDLSVIEFAAPMVADPAGVANSPIGYISQDALTELQDSGAPADSLLTLRHSKSTHRRAEIPVYLAATVKAVPSEALALAFSREDWGIIFDGVMLEIERSQKRKEANTASNSDERVEQGKSILAAIRKVCAAPLADKTGGGE